MPSHKHAGMREFDHPITEIELSVQQHAALGHFCYQKYTCANCGERKTMEEPNILYTKGKCESCGYVTDIVANGCNYLLVIKNAAR